MLHDLKRYLVIIEWSLTMFIELFPAVDVYISGDWLLGGLGIHPDYQRPIKKKSDWTTAGIHVGSTQP